MSKIIFLKEVRNKKTSQKAKTPIDQILSLAQKKKRERESSIEASIETQVKKESLYIRSSL